MTLKPAHRGDECGAMTGRLKVLVVAQCEIRARRLLQTLRSSGISATDRYVADAAALGIVLAGQHWDAVVSEFDMRAWSGLTALHIVRSIGRDTPFVFVSSTPDPGAAVAAIKAGANDYLQDWDLARLAPVLLQEIERAAERATRQGACRPPLRDADAAPYRLAQPCTRGKEPAWQLVLSDSPLAHLLQHPSSGIRCVNNQFLELTGYHRQELVGNRVEDLGLVAAGDAECHLPATLDAPGDLGRPGLSVQRKDGTRRAVLARSGSVVLNGVFHRLHSLLDARGSQATQSALLDEMHRRATHNLEVLNAMVPMQPKMWNSQ